MTAMGKRLRVVTSALCGALMLVFTVAPNGTAYHGLKGIVVRCFFALVSVSLFHDSFKASRE